MRVAPGIDQLRIHSHVIRDTLHASFQYVRDAKLPGDHAKVACCPIPVLHHACAANYLQISDLREISPNFILHTIGEIDSVRIATQVFKRQHCNAFVWLDSEPVWEE